MVSPSPSIRPLLVRISGRAFLTCSRTARLTSYWLLRRTCVLEPGDRFEVMVEHFGAGSQHDVDQVATAVEVGREHLDRGAGAAAHGQDAPAELLGPAVGAGRRGSPT